MENHCYQINIVRKLELELKKENRSLEDFDHVLATNSSFLYQLSSGEIFLVPNQRRPDQLALRLNNLKCFETLKQQDNFPILNDNLTIFETQSQQVTEINKVEQLTLDLSKKYQTKTSTLSLEFLQELIVAYHSRKKMKSQQLDDFLFSFGILVGEHVKKTMHASQWILWKDYGTFNPYYKPILIDEHNMIFDVFAVTSSFVESGIDNISFLLNMLKINSFNIDGKRIESSRPYHVLFTIEKEKFYI